MKAICVLLFLLTEAWAGPLEGHYGGTSSVATQQTPAAPRVKPLCPPGTYRSSVILWHCNGTGGQVFFFMQPKGAHTALEIPRGAKDVSINASADVDATLLLADASSKSTIFDGGGTAPGQSVQRSYEGMQITVIRHQKGSPGLDALSIRGKVTTPLLLKFESSADNWRTMTLRYSYQGLDACTPNKPRGCSDYDLSEAHTEVKKWSNWMRENLPDPAQAWENIAHPFSEKLGRSPTEAGQTTVPWYKWNAVWAQWPENPGVKSGWQAFNFLDRLVKTDDQISFDELRGGWDLGNNIPLVVDSSSPPATVPVAPAPVPPPQPAGQRTSPPRNNLEARHDITPGGNQPAASGGGGGLPSFLPVWLIWAVPLLALACLCVRFFVRDPVRLPYHHVPKSEPLAARTQPPVPADRWNQDYRQQPAGAGAPTMVLSPQDKVLAPGGGAPQTQQPPGPEISFQSRTVRACDEGWARLGLLDCGLRGNKSVGAKAADKPGNMREPERQGQVLPPVLAWRGPDESTEDMEIRQIIRSMGSEPQNEFVQESSCERLEDMALNAAGRQSIADAGGIQAIVRAMNTHSKSAAVQEFGCGALGNEALNSERFQKMIANDGGIEAILRAMKGHLDLSAVQEKACWALQQLALTQDNRFKIARSQGVVLITHAMNQHLENEAVQEHGCMAIGNLAYDVETREDIVMQGALDAMVEAMNQFPHEKVLQENACFALHNLACSDEAMKPIIDAGGIEAIVQAMKEHRMEAGVQENAINALHNINCGPLKHVHKVVALDGINYIVSAMHAHTVAGLQATACHVLGQLGDRDPEVRDRIRDAGGFERIMIAQTRFQNSKEVQQAAREATNILNS